MNNCLAELVQNRLVVLFLLFFCSQNKYPDRDGAGTGGGRLQIIWHGSAGKVGDGIFFSVISGAIRIQFSRPVLYKYSLAGRR